MADKNQEQPPGGGKLALLAVFAAALLASLSLTRPVANSSRTESGSTARVADPQLEDARLWQDPLSVVKDQSEVDRLVEQLKGQLNRPACNDQNASGRCAADTSSGAPARDARPQGPDLHILAILLPSGPSSEDKERRLRARRAVLGALQRWGYEPDDPNHLKIRVLNFGLADSSTAASNPPLRIATESYSFRPVSGTDGKNDLASEKSPGDHYPVRVYWLSDNLLRRQGSDHYKALVTDVRNIDSAPAGALEARQLGEVLEMLSRERSGGTNGTLQIIGPLDRNLAALIVPKLDWDEGSSFWKQEAKDKISAACQPPAASVSGDKAVLASIRKVRLYLPFGDAQMEAQLKRSLCFMPVVIAPEDKTLATALIDELERRGLQLRRPSRDASPVSPDLATEVHRHSCAFDDHVALINEWDSDTSRDFRRTFTGEIAAESTQWKSELANHAANVHGFSFIRGLDGRFAGDGAKTENSRRDADANKDNGPRREPNDAYERSSGESQRDYLGRLADEIARRDEALRLACGRPGIGIKAVGLLASDFYDKLMLLQTLKGRFPGMLFFTTEMDARFLDHQFVPDTRNLIVAAHYGLKLAPAIQRFITPFRDSAQTGLFLTSSVALASALEDKNVSSVRSIFEQVHQWRGLSPRVFEIGLTRAHLLTSYSDQHRCPLPPDTESVSDNLLGCEDLHPERQLLHGLTVMRVMLAVGGVALMSYLAICALLSPGARRYAAWTLIVLVSALFVPMLLYALLSYSFEFWQEEPLAWVDGVSMWLSLWLSWLAMVVSVAAVVWGRRQLAHSIADTETSVLNFTPLGSGIFGRPRQTRLRLGREWRRYRYYLRLWLRRPRTMWISPQLTLADRVEPTNCWIRYRGRLRPGRQLLDAACWALVILLAMIPLVRQFPPHLPIRGMASRELFIVVAGATFACFLILLFLALNSAILTREFARRIGVARSHWLEPTLSKWKVEFLGRDGVSLPESPAMNLGLDHYLDVRLLAEASKGSQVLLYLPGLSLALILLARSPTLDNWLAESTVAVVLAIFAVVSVVAVLLGYWTGKTAREDALDGLRRAEALAEVTPSPETLPILREMRRQVEEIHEGIFSPAVSSLLKTAGIPALSTLGAMGGLPLVEQALSLLR